MTHVLGRDAERTRQRGSGSAALFDEARRYIPGGTSRLHNFFTPHPIYMRSGAGCRLTDVDGVERLDFLNNMTALIHGHADPVVTDAIVDQARRGTAFSEPCEPEVALAKLLCHRVPSLERIRFANSGTEAVMMALKLARAFTGRSRIAKFEGFYHGYYDYVQVSYASTPGNWGPSAAPASVPSSGGLAESAGRDVVVLPFNNRAAVERLFEEHGSGIAALIMDPLSQRAGFPTPSKEFYAFLRDITQAYGIVLIYDEVISFRLGYHGAQGVYGGEPDLTTLGKIMGGGLPVGAVGGRHDIMALLDPTRGSPTVVSGGTFSANPLSMAAGLAAMEQLAPADFNRLNSLGAELRARGTAVFQAAGQPGQLAGDGSLFRILLTERPIDDYRTLVTTEAPHDRHVALHQALLEEGIVVSTGLLGCLSTPMAAAEVDAFVAGLARAVQSTA